MKEGSLVAEFKKETAPGVALTHSSPGVSYNVTGMVSHLRGGAVLPMEEMSNGAVTVQNGGDDGTVAYCVERIGYIHSNNGILLVVCEVSHPGAKLHAAAKATADLYGS